MDFKKEITGAFNGFMKKPVWMKWGVYGLFFGIFLSQLYAYVNELNFIVMPLISLPPILWVASTLFGITMLISSVFAPIISTAIFYMLVGAILGVIRGRGYITPKNVVGVAVISLMLFVVVQFIDIFPSFMEQRITPAGVYCSSSSLCPPTATYYGATLTEPQCINGMCSYGRCIANCETGNICQRVICDAPQTCLAACTTAGWTQGVCVPNIAPWPSSAVVSADCQSGYKCACGTAETTTIPSVCNDGDSRLVGCSGRNFYYVDCVNGAWSDNWKSGRCDANHECDKSKVGNILPYNYIPFSVGGTYGSWEWCKQLPITTTTTIPAVSCAAACASAGWTQGVCVPNIAPWPSSAVVSADCQSGYKCACGAVVTTTTTPYTPPTTTPTTTVWGTTAPTTIVWGTTAPTTTVTECVEGWTCRDSYRVFLAKDCSEVHKEFCSKGCIGGECSPTLITIVTTTTILPTRCTHGEVKPCILPDGSTGEVSCVYGGWSACVAKYFDGETRACVTASGETGTQTYSGGRWSDCAKSGIPAWMILAGVGSIIVVLFILVLKK